MLLLTISDFRSNMSSYLKRALTERIAVKSPSGIFEITPSKEIFTNPSPSGDTFYDNPKNIEHLNRAIEEAHAEGAKRYSWDEIKHEVGL